MNIEDFRERQWQDYRDSALVDEIELTKCSCCCYEVENSDIKIMAMHDINDAKELPYCIECIEFYKSENL